MIHRRRTKSPVSRRKATATVELAVCLPTLVFTLLAAMQAADMIFLKQTVQVASYEAARAAIKRNATNDQAIISGQEILTNRKVAGFAITFDPNDVRDAERGELVSVTVAVPADINTVLPDWFPLGQDLTVTTRMVKE